jgi:hypothetical protein
MSEEFGSENFISDRAVDPRTISPVPPVKVQDGVRFSCVITEPMHTRGVLQFELLAPADGGSTEGRWALERSLRERIGLEESHQYMAEAIGFQQQVRITRVQGSGFEVGMGCLFAQLEIEVLDTVDIEFVVFDDSVEGVEIKVRPAADQALNRELAEILEFTEPDSEVSPFWFFAEDFLIALIKNTHPVRSGENVENHVGGVELSSALEEAAHAWMQWVWVEKSTLMVVAPASLFCDEDRLAEVEAELHTLGFVKPAGDDDAPWVHIVDGKKPARDAAALIIKTLRLALKGQVTDIWKFSPSTEAGNTVIRSARKGWLPFGPAYVESASAAVRTQFETGFALPGPLFMPKWIAPFFTEG